MREQAHASQPRRGGYLRPSRNGKGGSPYHTPGTPRALPLHPGFPQAPEPPTQGQYAQQHAQNAARTNAAREHAQVALQSALAAVPAASGASKVAPLSLVPSGVVFPLDQLRASGRLREGFILDLNAAVVHAPLSHEQMAELVKEVTRRVAEQLNATRGRTYADTLRQVPAAALPTVAAAAAPQQSDALSQPSAGSAPQVPSRSAPAHTLQHDVRVADPTPAQAAQMELQRKRAEQVQRKAHKQNAKQQKALAQPKPVASSTHGMQTRHGAVQKPNAAPAQPEETRVEHAPTKAAAQSAHAPSEAAIAPVVEQPAPAEGSSANPVPLSVVVDPNYRPIVPKGWQEVKDGNSKAVRRYKVTAGPSGNSGVSVRV